MNRNRNNENLKIQHLDNLKSCSSQSNSIKLLTPTLHLNIQQYCDSVKFYSLNNNRNCVINIYLFLYCACVNLSIKHFHYMYVYQEDV